MSAIAEKKPLDIRELLPHAGEMVFLESVLDCDRESIRCRAVSCSSHASLSGRKNIDAVPNSVGVEYMAQAAAAFSALNSSDGPRVGFLIAVRELEATCKNIDLGTELVVEARLSSGNEFNAVFDCSITAAESSQSCLPLLRGSLHVHIPKELS